MGPACCKTPQQDDLTLVKPDCKELIDLINRLDDNIVGSLRSTSSSQLSLILPASKHSKHFLIIRYYLLYSFYIAKYNHSTTDKVKCQQHFFALIADSCKQKQEENKLLEAIRKEYRSMKASYIQNLNTKEQKTSQDKLSLSLLQNAMKCNFILEHINKILLASDDPTALSHFIFPIHALHAAIKSNFKKPDINRKESIWIVAVLQDTEIQILKKMEGTQNYFFFSVFIRGFTQKKYANEAFKTLKSKNKQNTFLFTVNFPYPASKLRTQQNKGFFIYKDASQEIKQKGDVIFNIMNSFKLSSHTNPYQYDIDYGELARLFYQKTEERFIGKQPLLLKIYELCRGVSKFYLPSQSCLCRFIGNKEQSLNVSHLVVSGIKAKEIEAPVNDIQRYNIISTFLQNKQLQMALSNVGNSDNLLLKAKKIHVLYQNDKFQEAQAEIKKIDQKKLHQLQNLQSWLIVDVIKARIQMKNQQYLAAKNRLQSVYNTVYKHYPQDVQFICRDVIRALIELEIKGNIKIDMQELVRKGGYDQIELDNLSLSSISISTK